MRAIAAWCVRHRRLVVLAWLGVLVLSSVVSHVVGSAYSNTFRLPDTESSRAIHLLQTVSPKVSGDTERVVFATSGGATITDPAIEAQINKTLQLVRTMPHVTAVERANAQQTSRDGTIAFANVTFDEQANVISHSDADKFVKAAQSGASPQLRIAVSGQIAEDTNKGSIGGTGPGIILAALVLLLVFGSLYAMALPIVSALVSLGTAIGLIGLLSHLIGMPQFSPELVLLIGLGVGVDYALFIVTRHRQGLMAGRDTKTSIADAVNTSGRAVLFAGIIVCIALLGMFALGVSFLYGMAVAASIGVALTMLAAITLLPAMLGFIGPRVMSRRQKKELATKGARVVGAGATGFWPRWADFVRRRPVIPAVVALAIVGTLAIPYFSMRLGSSDQGNDPASTTTRQAYDLLAKGFGPGFNGPLMLVAVIQNPAEQSAFDRALAKVKDQRDVVSVSPPQLIPDAQGSKVALVNVYPGTSPQDAATTNLIDHLRRSTLPSATAGSGLHIYVAGSTAIFVDFAHVLSGKLFVFIGVVVLLSMILLSFVFRSLVIPVLSAVMNLLSIGAAFGVLVATFQWGWLGSIVGSSRPGPIEAFLPVMVFAILFGLSMDYQVFLVSRMHEERIKSGNNIMGVRRGLAATGKTITAAALIMIFVFGSFIFGGELVIKEFGVALAAGILVDAAVIRMAIVPALMLLTGESNWWFPRWIDRWLPHIGIGGLDGEQISTSSEAVDPDLVRS